MATVGQDVIDMGVHAALVANDLVDDEGAKDITKLRARIIGVVVKHKALGRLERPDKAITRGELVDAVFPQLPDPDDDDEAKAALAEAIRSVVDKKLVWPETNMSYRSPVQGLIAQEMGNGYVMCRTKIGKDRVDAVYVTDNLECIGVDFIQPATDGLNRAIETQTKNREMLMHRQPGNAQRYAQGFSKALKAAGNAANDQLQLTLESLQARNGSADAGTDDDGEE